MDLALISIAAALVCTPVLEINAESGSRERFALDINAGFSVTYWHSMYDAPVTESFVVGEREIRLTTVRSPSAAVLEYLAVGGSPDQDVAVARRFDSIAFRVATKEPQRLAIGERQWSFREFGGPGARLVFVPQADCTAK